MKIKVIKKNTTLKKVAEEVGISPCYLGRIIYGEKKGTEYIPLIANILDINLSKYKEAV
ncbi:helix-turn-helix transcriptional regulator [Tyzzerella sp. OttesenSCG-928-J15]|nr:helix-turn-helix transcriptional regulator [Tyzzerella sp. OttesenSCG-928-J15]